jgi:hypothetical protein
MYNVGLAQPILMGAQAQATPSTAATLAKPTAETNLILLGAFTANVTFTLDGTTPTASVGFTIKSGEPPILVSVPENATLKVFSATGTLNYQWLKA